MFSERTKAACVSNAASEAALQAVYGTVGWGLRGEVYGLEYDALGPSVYAQGDDS